MYAPPPVVVTTERRNMWPLAAICCLGLVGFLIAATIVLALIPVYLPSKDVTVKNNNNNNTVSGEDDSFYLQYESDGNSNSSYTGTVEDLPALEKYMNDALGLNNEMEIDEADLQTAFQRRRRSLTFHHNKRAIKNKCLLKCKPKYKRTCTSSSCRTAVKTRIQNACQRVRTIPNVPFQIRNRQFGLRSITLSLTFIGLSFTRPRGFGGEPSVLGQFVAVNSGEFNNPSTWAEGIVPYGESSIVISTGVVVTLSNAAIELYLRKCDIYGTLVLGSSANPYFIFYYSTNIIVHSGGTLLDRTGSHVIYSPVGTLLRIYPGGSFTGSDTDLRTYTSLPAPSNSGASLKLGSSLSGPFTCGILSSTVILSFEKVTYIASQSGDFTVSSTWLGGIVPDAETCNSVGGCGLYISPGCILSTAGLNNQLNINFSLIIISKSGSLQLGTTSISGGFTFYYAVNIIVQSGGRLEDQTSINRFYCLAGTIVTFYSGASFIGTNTQIFTYTSLPATGSLGASYTFGSSISGPFTFCIFLDGSIQTFAKVTFIAAISGSFTATTTWLGGIVPTVDVCNSAEGCGLYISPGCILSTASLNNRLNIKFSLIIIARGGSLQLGTPSISGGFTFYYTVNIIVQSGGTLEDQTSINRFYCLAGTIITFYSGGFFLGTNTQVVTYTSLPAIGSLGVSFTLGSSISGPFTLGILLDGSFRNFTRVTFIVAVSGDFAATATWIGGLVPTTSVCDSVGGCSLYIPSGCVLSTASLNNQLNINFNLIIIANGGSLQLGTTSISGGFTFYYAVSIIVQSGGRLEDQTSIHRFYCLAGTVITFYSGASFIGTNTQVFTYTSLPATESLGANYTFGSSISGPFTLCIFLDGSIQTFAKVTFIAAVSGSFTTTTTWLGGTVPTFDICNSEEGCALYVSPGCTLVTASLNNQLNIKFSLIIIAKGGLLQLGTPSISGGFTFYYAVNIIVQSGGTLEDQTSIHRFYCLAGTIVTFYSGALFIGTNTQVFTYTSLPAIGSLGASYTFGYNISGPFTFAILLDGSIQTFTKVTFIVAISGSFTATTTWIGGFVPTASVCNLNNGCGLYISSGCILSTASLNNQLNINFNLIIIATSGSLQLGTTSITGGFTFYYAVNIIVQSGGRLEDQTSINRFYCLAGTIVTFYSGASFIGTNTQIFTYITLPAIGSLGASYTFGSTITGPFTFCVFLDGSIQTFAKVTFIAAVSGSFTATTTWIGGIVPTFDVCNSPEGCALYVAPGCILSTVSLNNELNIKFSLIIIAKDGSLQLGTTSISGGFTFYYAVNIIVQSGGKLEDQTSNNRFYCLAGTIVTFYSGASFIGTNTQVFTYTSIPAIGSLNVNFTLGSSISGPFTFAILLDGSIQTFTRVTFIAVVSGSFVATTTWLGGFVPTAEVCNSTNGCGLYVSPGCILSTASLNNQLNINFNLVIVANGGSLQLGTTSISGGFTFYYAVNIIVQSGGTLEDQTSINRFYCLAGTIITFYSGGFFLGTNTQVVTYTSLPAIGSLGVSFTLGSSISGPFTLGILLDGSFRNFTRVTFIVAVSGDFAATATWIGGLVPTTSVCDSVGGCSLYIPSGCVLSTASLNNQLNINFNLIIIANGGSLQLGTATISGGFTFYYAVSIIVQSGGRLEDQTGIHRFYCLAGTIITFYSGASFIGTNTQVFTYTSLPATGSLGANYTFGSSISGPFTFCIFLDGSIQTFAKVTFIAAVSGSFTTTTTWLGGIVPTFDVCNSVEGCALYVSPGCTLVTASLNNQLNIKFSLIIIAKGGLLQLGTPSIHGGFTFYYAVNIIVQSGGTLEDQTSIHRFYCLAGTIVTFSSGALFIENNTQVFTYTSLPAIGSLSVSFTFGSNISGPFTFAILLDGSIQTFTKVTFIAAISGSFTATTTWIGGFVPTASVCNLNNGCGLYISSGCILSTASLNNQLNINFNLIIIATSGSLQLGTTSISGGFTFYYAVSIIVQSGGKLEDQTSVNRFYCLAGTIITFYSGASFIGTNTQVFTYTSLPATGSLGASYTFGSAISGPFTFCIFLDGSIQTFAKVTFIAAISGSFTATTTWLGGIVPTVDVCNSTEGCALYVSSGCTLSTVSLNNQLNIKFSLIIIAKGGSLQLGTTSISGGFTFYYAVNIIVQSGGTLEDQTSIKRFYCLAGTIVTFSSGASFIGTNTQVFTYTSLPAIGSLSVSFTFGSNISGPFTFAILLDGSIQTFTKVTFIAAISGSFTATTTWLGGLVPTFDVCNSAEGCALYVSPGCILSTVSLNNQLNIKFSLIIIVQGASLQLGTSTISGGFTFYYAVSIIVQSGGKLEDQTSVNRFYCLAGTIITFYSGASFIGTNTRVFTYTSLPATESLGANYTFGSAISGPFTFCIFLDGSIQTFAKVTFIAAISGSFTDTTTWLGGIVPTVDGCNSTEGCGLYVSPGCILSTVSLNNQLNIKFSLIIIVKGGSLQLGTTSISGGFTFYYAVNIIVQSGGKLEDQTSNNRFYCLAGTIVTFYSSALFIGTNTQVFTYTSLPAIGSLSVSFTFGSSISGPFTFAILLDGSIQTFTKVTFIAVISGSFTATTTWLGGFVPTISICSSNNGCGLYISSGCILSTASLNNQLNINFNLIIIATSGSLQLGTTSINGGFTFYYAVNIIVQSGGKLEDRTSVNRFYCLAGTIITFYSAASFIGTNTQVFIYTSLPATGSLGANYTFGSSISGPFTFCIFLDGSIQTFAKVTFIAAISGSFTTTTTWLGGIVPTFEVCNSTEGCGLYVSPGCILSTVSLNNQLNIKFSLIIIAKGGSLQLGTTSISGGFTFYYAVNIIVQSGGKLDDQTSNNRFYCLAGTIVTFYSGASFIGTNTQIFTYISLPAIGSLNVSFTLGSSISGPFTLGILLDGSIQTFSRVTFIAVVSGSFAATTTWIGGLVPTTSVCNLNSGCGLYISPGCILSTASLNNELTINFNLIIIAKGGSLQLGTTSISGGFTFYYAVNIIVQSGGKLEDHTSVNRFYCVFGTIITFYSGASFIGTNTQVFTYTSLPATGSLGVSYTFGSSISGPFTFCIFFDGSIQTFAKVTFIVAVTGSFTATTTWLGGIVPTFDVCNGTEGCALYVSPGCILSTVSLNNQLDIKFSLIIIAKGGSLQLGTTSISEGFTFYYAVNIIVQSGGKLEDQTSIHRFYCLAGTIITFYSGALFNGTNTQVFTYTSLPATGSLNVSFTLGSSISGPFTLGILLDGSIQTFTRVTFIAVVSGSFVATTTWLGGFVPTISGCNSTNGCGLYVSPGCILSTASLNNQLNINFNVIIITKGGSLQLGTTSISGGFIFYYAVNIIVQSGGKLEDQTSINRLYCLAGSLFTFYSGASFIGTNTQVITYISLPATGSAGASFTFGSSLSGPFTCGILLDGSIQTFAKVTFIAAVSGSFTAATTWLGGIVPTPDTCPVVDGCGLYISSGCALSTASLNGELDINFNLITIAAGGVCQLGTAGVNIGFRFRFSFVLNCYGELIDVSGGTSGIYIPVSSSINFFFGGSFSSQVSTSLYVYSVATGLIIGTPLVLDASIVGSYFISVQESGEISTGTVGE